MKKNMIHTIRQLADRFTAWVHLIIEKKGDHFEACAWYPGPCQTEFPF